jgi:hypothetical protein
MGVLLDEKLIFETSEKLCSIEFDILNVIGFDLNIDLPYKYIHLMKSYYIEYLKNSKLITITTNFINDSFKLPLILYHDPLLIALASLYLVSAYFKVPLPKTKEGEKWYHLLDKNVKLEDVVLISDEINKIYKFCNETKCKKTELKEKTHILEFDSKKCILDSNNQEDARENDHDGKINDITRSSNKLRDKTAV